jgi:hypothetical protein
VFSGIKPRKEALQMKFIGMDVHSRNSFFVVLGKSGRVVKRAKVKSQEDKLLGFVRSIKGPKKLAFEEGVMSKWLYLLFKDEVDDLVVCQPREKKGPKTDEIDAGELADLLRVGRLKSVFHSDSLLMNLRVLTSGYDDATQELTRIKNRYKAVYRQDRLCACKSDCRGDGDTLPVSQEVQSVFVRHADEA